VPLDVAEIYPRRVGRLGRNRDWRWSLAIPVLAAAAVAVMVLRPGDAVPPDPGENESTRIKGADRLKIHRKTGRGGAEALADAAFARAGDILQLGYAASTDRYGVIVSVDGLGTVTLHYPDSPEGSTLLGAPGTLRSAYQLDGAPDFERFILVTSRSPVQIDRVLQAARALAAEPGRGREGRLDLPSDFAQSSLLIRKVQP
jgi:hypothetical protein